jgi:transposase
MRPKA